MKYLFVSEGSLKSDLAKVPFMTNSRNLVSNLNFVKLNLPRIKGNYNPSTRNLLLSDLVDSASIKQIKKLL